MFATTVINNANTLEWCMNSRCSNQGVSLFNYKYYNRPYGREIKQIIFKIFINMNNKLILI